MEEGPELTLQAITTECQRLVNLKHDTAVTEHRSSPEVHAVSQKAVPKEVTKTDSSKKRIVVNGTTPDIAVSNATNAVNAQNAVTKKNYAHHRIPAVLRNDPTRRFRTHNRNSCV